jgi:NAD(P)-dependent dehydrogenase (short-subunit alcohol dehydrogenase family)
LPSKPLVLADPLVARQEATEVPDLLLERLDAGLLRRLHELRLQLLQLGSAGIVEIVGDPRQGVGVPRRDCAHRQRVEDPGQQCADSSPAGCRLGILGRPSTAACEQGARRLTRARVSEPGGLEGDPRIERVQPTTQSLRPPYEVRETIPIASARVGVGQITGQRADFTSEHMYSVANVCLTVNRVPSQLRSAPIRPLPCARQRGKDRSMGSLEGRVAIITGAGRGLGREHALLFAAEGAKVVVNDRGGANDGAGTDDSPAHEVVTAIEEQGGEAVANFDDVADWEGAQRMINAAIDTFGGLDILVNNAGILRDRVLVNMSEPEWDEVVRVHLRGHFAPTRWAAAYWREEAKNGRAKPRNLVHTSSTSGLFSNPGQSNYGAAKSAIATFSQIVAKELSRYEVKSNCIAPAARTRLTLATPGLEDIMTTPEGAFDVWDPANVSPLVAYLSTAGCPFTGETFFVQGGVVKRVQSWTMAETVERTERWTVEELGEALNALA